MIDVSSHDPAAVLAALYNHSRPIGLGFLQATPEDMTTDEARELLGEPPTYFDYLKGRVMKISVGNASLDERLYDRDNGTGAAVSAIATIPPA